MLDPYLQNICANKPCLLKKNNSQHALSPTAYTYRNSLSVLLVAYVWWFGYQQPTTA